MCSASTSRVCLRRSFGGRSTWSSCQGCRGKFGWHFGGPSIGWSVRTLSSLVTRFFIAHENHNWRLIFFDLTEPTNLRIRENVVVQVIVRS